MAQSDARLRPNNDGAARSVKSGPSARAEALLRLSGTYERNNRRVRLRRIGYPTALLLIVVGYVLVDR